MQADGRTDRADTTKVTVAFRNSAHEPKNSTGILGMARKKQHWHFGHGKKEPKLERMLQKLKISDPRLDINPLNPELNPICYLLALLAHHFLHVSRIRVKSLILRLLMSYIYGISSLRDNEYTY